MLTVSRAPWPPPAGEDGGEHRWPAVLRVLHGMQMGMPNYKDTHVQVGPRLARCCGCGCAQLSEHSFLWFS